MVKSEQEQVTPDIAWGEIRKALTKMIDFSQPQINHEVVKKFVSKIVPNGKNHFRWYMNLDGSNTTSLDLVTEGRKNNAVVAFDDEGDEPPLHTGEVLYAGQFRSYA